MTQVLEVESSTIVLVGSFNAAIFQPAWLARVGLLPELEAESAEVKVIHPEIAIFSTDWLQLNVTQQRFAASTAQASHREALRDLVLGVFETLSHTPVQAMGLNQEYHFRMDSLESWHGLGFRLVPRAPWETVFSGEQEAGMRTLTVEGRRPDSLDGYLRVKVEPSNRIKPGVFVHVNDHYVLGDSSVEGAAKALEVIRDRWKWSVDHARQLSETLLTLED